MQIAVLGLGYLGAVHAATLASLGHTVTGIDPQQQRVSALASASAPFHEPGFAELLEAGVASGRLQFSTDAQHAAGAELIFLTVGTPQDPHSAKADLSQIHSAIADLVPVLTPHSIVVGKSTVPVGTARHLMLHIQQSIPDAVLAWNPEFLREGFAVHDSLHPDRVVYGLPDTPDHAQRAQHALDAAYAPILTDNVPVLHTNFETAELIKGAANAFLATKISFINALSEISEAAGADVLQLADALGHDARIGRKFLNAGLGFGGGCLPKDIRAFTARAHELGVGSATGLFVEADRINQHQRERIAALVLRELADLPPPHTVAVLGLSFKPESDDVRDSPAVDLSVALHQAGVTVRVTDPAARTTAAAIAPQLTYLPTPEEAVIGAHIVVLATEWAQYVRIDPAQLRKYAEAADPLIIDARNALNAAEWRAAGWRYRGIGRVLPPQEQ